MKVILAGYNVDAEVIEELKKSASNRKDITPETISASYARISRDPRAVDELRKIARQEVEKARRSNKNIIFGMGHHSVAEHAVFNFDIIGVSRLAIEEIEKFRLCSYTEKSQRYITLTDDFVIPTEIKKSPYKSLFASTVKKQNALYHKLYDKLKSYVFNKYPDMTKDKKEHKVLEGWAKEDARYIVSLATEGQLGETINARNLELVLRRFASHELSELRELGHKMHKLATDIAPSIILFYEANEYDQKTYKELGTLFQELLKDSGSRKKKNLPVQLVDYTPDADNITLAALLHSSSKLPFNKCLETARKMSLKDKTKLIMKASQHMELYDKALREFEYVNLTYDLVVSATCFAQLKRHRMATLISQKYNPELGVTIPEPVKEIGMLDEFNKVIQETNEACRKLTGASDTIAQYVLTNAHRKRVLLRVNARELYHISRLREDTTAQWDIRQLTKEMVGQAKKVMPLTLLLICGKDSYPELYKEIYGKLPQVIEPTLPT